METTLREVIALTPDDLAPVYRLATLQEDEGLNDAAEGTLLEARHKRPDAVEPNRMLAQFYARLVTALQAGTYFSPQGGRPTWPPNNLPISIFKACRC